MTHIPNSSSTPFTWTAPKRSGGNSNCVEVAHGITGVMPVRDSKNPAGPAIVFDDTAWNGFVNGLKTDTATR
ncbi:DUF397 domain-containing protein [Streptomyces tsukubensis]|uniref:DUF397 domain-containing protein n=1 Tax=Streptomyces tsukubensis TaxID=83656 RepID=A0A1V4A239_9ACTN|nr:DUF397 domain-containing protein [Streptomyces tsukubensis]OON72511.1 hypothetical protein B1H18_29400 [Streptomyces tsukubensis]QFR93634.1 DUF397 domain-containing protein [Streptomyces tsukubensis]